MLTFFNSLNSSKRTSIETRLAQCNILNPLQFVESLCSFNTSPTVLTTAFPPQLAFPLAILNYSSLFIQTAIIIIQHSTMKVYAGTYTGNIVILQGDHINLQPRVSRQISQNSIRSITLSQKQLLVGGYDQQFKSVHLSTGEQLKQSKQSVGIINCIRNISEKLAVIGLENGTIRFWDKMNWCSRKDVKEHKKGVTDIKIDKKGVMMVSIGSHQMIFWNLSTLKSIYHYRFQYESEHVLLSQDFDYLFLLGNRTIRKINTENNTQLYKIEINQKIQCGLIFNNYLLIATEKGEIKIWTHDETSKNIHFKAHQTRIKDIKSVKIDEMDLLVTADSNGEISVWDILQFLKGVDSISQDYNLEGLKPLTTFKIKQRVISIEVAPLIVHHEDQPKQNSEQQEEEVVQESRKQKKKKKKVIVKQLKNTNKNTHKNKKNI